MTHENSKGQAYLNCKGGIISESLSLQKNVPNHYPKLLFTLGRKIEDSDLVHFY